MLVKLLVARAGNDFSQNFGEIVDMSEEEANELIAAGQAEPVATQGTRSGGGKPSSDRDSQTAPPDNKTGGDGPPDDKPKAKRQRKAK